MTQKKFWVWLMLTVFMSLTFNACDDDGDDYYGYNTANAPFLGTWYGMSTDITFTFNSSGYGTYTNQYGQMYDFTWYYDEDGSVYNPSPLRCRPVPDCSRPIGTCF